MRLALALPALILVAAPASAQMDPAKRRLLQMGYYQSIDGRAPVSGYIYYYHNQPDFPRKGRTLRIALAPVYADMELGVARGVDRHTDFGVGVAGGGFADSYQEIRGGRYLRGESFVGHGGRAGAGLYHDFDLKGRVPLAGVLRGEMHHAEYFADNNTEPGFIVPGSLTEGLVRGGLRWGGSEPVILPTAAFELSGWYMGRFRTREQEYGYARDRRVEPHTHQLWGRTLFYWNPPKAEHRFQAMLSMGRTVQPDRFSAYRLGGVLPMASEFPLSIPGYYYQEVSARSYGYFGGSYRFPLTSDKRTLFASLDAAGAVVHYAPGQAQKGRTHTGFGTGLTYSSPNGMWQSMLQYGYGVNAARGHGNGSHAVGLMVQLDFTRLSTPIQPRVPNRGVDRALDRIDRGIDRILKPR